MRCVRPYLWSSAIPMIVDAQIVHGFVQTLMSLFVGFVVLLLFGREGPKRIVPCQVFGGGRLCQDTVAAFEGGSIVYSSIWWNWSSLPLDFLGVVGSDLSCLSERWPRERPLPLEWVDGSCGRDGRGGPFALNLSSY